MGVRSCLLFLLIQKEFLEQVGEVLTRILLLSCFEFFMTFSNQGLKDGRSNSILVKLVLFLLFRSGFLLFNSNVDLLCNFFLRVFPRLQTDDKFRDLALNAVRCPCRACIQVMLSER